MSIAGVHLPTMGKDEWLTPPHVLAALGEFDLDPCSPVNRPFPTAMDHYTVLDDGLLSPWRGRVWCNPPYGREAASWLAKCRQHGDAVALVFARTETAMFFEHVWGAADAILFLQGRLTFLHVDGTPAGANSGGPSCLIAYGASNAEVLRDCGLPGAFVRL